MTVLDLAKVLTIRYEGMGVIARARGNDAIELIIGGRGSLLLQPDKHDLDKSAELIGALDVIVGRKRQCAHCGQELPK